LSYYPNHPLHLVAGSPCGVPALYTPFTEDFASITTTVIVSPLIDTAQPLQAWLLRAMREEIERFIL
jgi:hypothetical protein